jgi:nicotinamide-nucleotide amidase
MSAWRADRFPEMDAEIIAVGSELLTPKRIDTNSLFLTEQLNNLGVEVLRKSVLGDDLARLTAGIAEALGRVDLLVLTGGLGPTEDDLTREAVAAAIGRGMTRNEAILDQIRARFARFGRKMAATNHKQADVIEEAVKLENPNGTAPGQWVDHNGRIILLLPGPPGEMKPMFLNECLPRLKERVPRLFIRTKVFRVSGMGESDLDQIISPAYMPYTNPVTTVLAAPGDIEIHLRARCDDAGEAQRLVDELGAKIEALLGDRIYSTNGDALEVVVGGQLSRRSATLAVAESCTGGMLGARITEVPGSSNYFLGGFQVYATEMKSRLLGLDAAMVREHGAVSEAVAQAMAVQARERTGATFALSVTGEAGPESSSPGVDVGTVWIGLAAPDEVTAQMFRFPGNRARIRGFAAQTALNLLRRKLL